MTQGMEPKIAAGLNTLLVMVRWLEDGRLSHLDNNVHLAAAVSEIRQQHTSQSHIQAIRQGKALDPRWSVVCAICEVLTDRAGLDITPNYFFDPAEQTRVNDLLATRLDLLQERLQESGERGSTTRG